MFSIEEVFQAYFDCRKRKRNTYSASDFESRLEPNLVQLCRDLNSGEYRIGRSICFVVTEPKYREVWAANFRDRVVHHIIHNRIAARFVSRFIYDTYACIPARGVLFGAKRVHGFMRQATENWQRPAWYLQADLANFFVSIDRQTLAEIILARVPEPELRSLISQVIFHDPTRNPRRNSPRRLFRCVPRHKSLFHCGAGKGLPIGNLSSQFFANVYMNELDQLAKRQLGLRWYGRYVDDVVLVSHDPAGLNRAFAAMSDFVEQRLQVRFHPDKTARNRVETGINFCGQVLRPHCRYMRRRTARALHRAVADHDLRRQDPALWSARANSYLGFAGHADTWNLRKRIAAATGVAFAPGLNKVITRRPACNM